MAGRALPYTQIQISFLKWSHSANPEISEEVIASFMKSIKKDSAISRVEEIAKSFKNKSKPQTQTLEARLKKLADKE